MQILGIDGITHGVEDLPACRQFFLDWGLQLVDESAQALDFETLNGCQVQIRAASDATLPAAIEPGPTLREAVWGVASAADLDALRARLHDLESFRDEGDSLCCTDPNGLGLRFRVSRKRAVTVQGVPMNQWGTAPQRVDQRSHFYDRAEPVEVGHIVFFTPDLDAVVRFYIERLGFALSDSYPGRGAFLRCAAEGGHHDVFFLQLPTGKRGLNHVAYVVRDIHEVFGGGLHISRCGWETDIGPGRHPVSSAYFWYVKNPGGALAEYYTDEDMLTAAWQPREFESRPENFAEWAVLGGLDGQTRRQKHGPAAETATLAGQAGRT